MEHELAAGIARYMAGPETADERRLQGRMVRPSAVVVASLAMKVRLARGERYPFLDFSETPGSEVGVSAAAVKRWRRVMKQFEAVQQEMSEAWREEHGSKAVGV
jgi:hypothetical protein